jgi:hypothetical protein
MGPHWACASGGENHLQVNMAVPLLWSMNPSGVFQPLDSCFTFFLNNFLLGYSLYRGVHVTIPATFTLHINTAPIVSPPAPSTPHLKQLQEVS